MRWGRDRTEAILLHLRCVLINGLWDDSSRFLSTQADFRLRSVDKKYRSSGYLGAKVADPMLRGRTHAARPRPSKGDRKIENVAVSSS